MSRSRMPVTSGGRPRVRHMSVRVEVVNLPQRKARMMKPRATMPFLGIFVWEVGSGLSCCFDEENTL